MKVNPTFTLLLSLTLAASSCSKDAPDAGLPPATQSGANTAGCLIDGERFVATGYGGSLLFNPIPALSGGFSFDSVYLVQFAGKYKGENAFVMLFLRNDSPGLHLLNKRTQYYPQGDPLRLLDHATFRMAESTTGEVYITDSQHTGQVTLSLANLTTGIGAGTFEFTAASQVDPTKTVTVTSGRFDRKQ